MKTWIRCSLGLTMVIGVGACSSGGTGPSLSQQAVVQGQVEQTSPEPTPNTVAPRAAATGAASVQTATVAEVAADGSLTTVAHANVAADGSFTVTGVPSGRSDLVVEAHASDGSGLGRVLVYGRTSAGDTIDVAPIDGETTVQALAWSSLKARGESTHCSPAELALYLAANASASDSILAANEIQVVADGAAAASDATTKIFANAGASLDASARAGLLTQAMAGFERARFEGITADSAHMALLSAALDAYQKAGVSAQALVVATAAAASTLDATVDGSASVRDAMDAEPVWMNLKARERLAASYEGGAEDSVALAIMNVLSSTEASLRGAATAADIRAALAVSDSTVADAMVQMLVPNASALMQSQVRAQAQTVLSTASLSTLFSSVATAGAAAQAAATYSADVKAAVQAMLQMAGRTDVDANALTALCIAARGGAYVRAT